MIQIAKPIIEDEEVVAVRSVMGSGQIAAGPMVTQFEEAFAAFSGASFGTATTSGTTALEVALRSLGVGAGDRVLTTPFSFIASTNCILHVGARPVFCDIDYSTFNLDVDKARDALEEDPNIKAILPVHLYGQCCDMGRINDLAQEYGIFVIEDACQAHGARWENGIAGSMGSAGAFSFYPTKNMTTGEGGMVLFRSQENHHRSQMIINHGMERRYHHLVIGYNYRMTSIAAVIGLEQLKKLPRFNDARRRNAGIFDEQISHPLIEKPTVANGAYHVYHQYTIKVKDRQRQALIDFLSQKGIGVGVYYPRSIPEQACFGDFSFRRAFPVTDLVKEEALSIPVHPAVTPEDAAYIAHTINSFEG